MTARRKRGSGTVEPTGTGWRFRCPDGGGGRFTSATFATEAEARAALAVFRGEVSKRRLVAPKGWTLAEYWEKSWEPRKAVQRPRSIRTWRSLWSSQLSRAPFAHKALAAITRREVRDWAERLTLGRPEHALALLRQVLADAMDGELVERNVAQGVQLSRRRSQLRTDTSPTLEEQRAVLECEAIPRHARLIVAFALGTGLRPGEWRNLELDDVSRAQEPWFVTVRKGSADGPTKGGRVRRVPLFGLAREAIETWLAQLPTFAPKNPHKLLFPQANGRRRRATLVLGSIRGRDAWHVYRELAGVTRDVRLHDFRHAAATDLLEGRRGRAWTPREVQRLLGHAAFATTERYYVHSSDEALFRAASETARAGRSVQDQSNGSDGVVGNGLVLQAIPTDRGPSSRLFPSSSRTAPQFASSTAIRNDATAFWTDAGLIEASQTVLSKLLAGKRIGPRSIAALAARVEAALMESEPTLRLLSRARRKGPHQFAALVELLDLILPDAQVSEAIRRKG